MTGPRTTPQRHGPLPMPDFDAMSVQELRYIVKCSHLLICAFDSVRRNPHIAARLTNFERRISNLRHALEAASEDE